MRELLSFTSSILSIHGFQLLFIRLVQKTGRFSSMSTSNCTSVGIIELLAFLMFGFIIIPIIYFVSLVMGRFFFVYSKRFIGYVVDLKMDPVGSTVFPFLLLGLAFFPIIIHFESISHIFNVVSPDQYIFLVLTTGLLLSYIDVMRMKIQV